MIYRAASALTGTFMQAAAPLAGASFRERLALPDGATRLPAGAIWVHGASVGELNAARSIIEALAAARPLIVTANTEAGRRTARGWGLPARLAPFDTPGAVARFLDSLRPSLSVTVENEIWPNRAAALDARGIPRAVIGARMSARSARRWERVPALVSPVLAGVAMLSAQDRLTEERLLRLGLPRAALAPRAQLKLLGPAAVAPDPSRRWPGCWLAASTHEGEDGAVLAAHARLSAARPGLRLILAPRHPRRADRVAALVAAQGLTLRRLGGAEVASFAADPAQVLLIDRLGAMEAAYAAAAVCLTGGSLVDRGGHTPWEPAAWGCALLHGPHVANFEGDYAALDAAGGALRTGDSPGDLVAALAGLLDDPARARAVGQAARRTLDALAPDPAPLVAGLLGLVGPSAARRDLAVAAARPDSPAPHKEAGP